MLTCYLRADPERLPCGRTERGLHGLPRHARDLHLLARHRKSTDRLCYTEVVATPSDNRPCYARSQLPLFLGVTTYIYFWPARYLRADTKITKDEQDVSSLDQPGTGAPLPDLTRAGSRQGEVVEEVKR